MGAPLREPLPVPPNQQEFAAVRELEDLRRRETEALQEVHHLREQVTVLSRENERLQQQQLWQAHPSVQPAVLPPHPILPPSQPLQANPDPLATPSHIEKKHSKPRRHESSWFDVFDMTED